MTTRLKNRLETTAFEIKSNEIINLEIVYKRESLLKKIAGRPNFVGMLCALELLDGEMVWLLYNDENARACTLATLNCYEGKDKRSNVVNINTPFLHDVKRIWIFADYNRLDYDDTWDRTKAEMMIFIPGYDTIQIPFISQGDERVYCLVCTIDIEDAKRLLIQPKMEFVDNFNDLISKYNLNGIESGGANYFEEGGIGLQW